MAPVVKALSGAPAARPAALSAAGTGKRAGRRLGKAERQRALLALLDAAAVSSQSELRVELQAEGLGATQATISRDLEELGVVKVRGVDGRLVYARPLPSPDGKGLDRPDRGLPPEGRSQGGGGEAAGGARSLELGFGGNEWGLGAPQALRTTLATSLVRLGATGNLVVAHTRPGHASVLASALDHAELAEIVGTVAGDDTVFIACAEGVRASGLAEHLAVLASSRGAFVGH